MAKTKVSSRVQRPKRRTEKPVSSGIRRAAKRAGIRSASALRSDLYTAEHQLGNLSRDLLHGTFAATQATWDAVTLAVLRRIEHVRANLIQVAEQVEYLPGGGVVNPFKTRHDGSTYPNCEFDNLVLKQETPPDAETTLGYAYHVTLADLIIKTLTGTDLIFGELESVEDARTLEHEFLKQSTLELKMLNVALAQDVQCGSQCADVTVEECAAVLRGIVSRMEAGTELTARLRRARWGNPLFGGGDALAEPEAQAAHDDAPESAVQS